MAKRDAEEFAKLVGEAETKVGRSAPKIADCIIRDLCPETFVSALRENVDDMLRVGVIAQVKRVLHQKREDDPNQIDFSAVDDTFAAYVQKLSRPSYYVPQLKEEVHVVDLIAQPAMLYSAYEFMKEKGVQCFMEAQKLKNLYEAVAERVMFAQTLGAPPMQPFDMLPRPVVVTDEFHRSL